MRVIDASLLSLLTAATASNLGDYVASGLGLSSETESTLSSSSSLSKNQTSTWSNSTSTHSSPRYATTTPSSSPLSSTATASTSSAEYAAGNETSTSADGATTSYSSTAAAYGGTSSIGLNSTQGNQTLPLSGDCWQQWNEYWSGGPTSSEVFIDTTSWYTTTFTNYYATGYSYPVYTAPSSTFIETETNVDYDGPDHPVRTYTTTETDKFFGRTDYTFSETATTSSSVITYVGSQFSYTTSMSTWGKNYPRPNCTLPTTVMSECEAQWSTYIASESPVPYDNSVSKPKCTQASITGAQCESLVAAYFYQYTMYGQMDNPGYTSKDGTTSYWPSTKSFAPGCTLGCQTCAITGEKVQLYYWPPATAAVINGTATAKPAVNSMNASGPVVANVNGTLLTSPTVYVSYDKLYAANSCHGIGKTYYNTIVPLTKNSDLSSMEFREVRDLAWYYETKSFNYSDLIEPIPESIYNKQPRCVESSLAYYEEGLGMSAPFTCPHIGPYAPIIAVPMEVTAIDPEWSSCTAWYGGLYDPPKALQPVNTEAGVTLKPGPTTTSASPGSTVAKTEPTKTTSPQQATTTEAGTQHSSNGSTPASTPDSQQIGDSGSNGDPAEATKTTAPADPSQTPADPSQTPDHPSNPGDPSQATESASPSNTAAGQIQSSDPTSTQAQPLYSLIGQIAGNTASTQATQGDSDPAEATSASANPTQNSQQHDPAVYTDASGNAAFSAKSQASSVVLAAPGTSVVLNAGQATSFAGHAVSVGSGGLQVDNSETLTLSSAVSFAAGAASVANPGNSPISLVNSGGSFIVVDGSSAATLDPGEGTVFAGHTVSAAQNGQYAVVDGTSIAATAAAPSMTAVSGATITGTNGQTFQVKAGDNGAVAFNSISTVSLTPGQATTFDGKTISVPQGGSSVIVDGTSTLYLPTAAAMADVSIVTGAHGQKLSISQQDGTLRIDDGSSAAALTPGQAITMDGRTISAGVAGSDAVIDGSNTLNFASIATDPSAMITGTGGQNIQLSEGNGEINVVDGSSTITLDPGDTTVVGGKTISAGPSGDYAVTDGSSTVNFDATSSLDEVQATITGTDGRLIRLAEHDNELIAIDGAWTATIAAGHATVVDGRTISAGLSDAVIDGTKTVLLDATSAQSSVFATVTGTDGQSIRLIEQNGPVAAIDGASTATIAVGHATVMDGMTISAQSSDAVIDGTRTVAFTSTGPVSTTTSNMAASSADSTASTSESSPADSSAFAYGTRRSFVVLWVVCIASLFALM